jgi:hypothetical protein
VQNVNAGLTRLFKTEHGGINYLWSEFLFGVSKKLLWGVGDKRLKICELHDEERGVEDSRETMDVKLFF